MKYRLILVVMVSLFSLKAFALLDFPAGVFILEGKVIIQSTDVYLVVNGKSNSESRIKLTGSASNQLLSQHGSNAAIVIKITKPFMSRLGEAEFIELKRYLDPFEVPVTYSVLK